MTAMLATAQELTNDDLLHRLTHAHDEMTRQKAEFLLSLAEFDARGLARGAGAPSTLRWLGRTFRLADKTAYEYLRIGKGVVKFPVVAAAFRDAELTYSQVRLLLRHLTIANELELLSLALSLSYSELELALAGRSQGDGGPDPERDSFRIWIDKKTGRYRFAGDLSPEMGAAFAAALKTGELANLRDLADIDDDLLADDDALGDLLDEADAPEEVEDPGGTPAVTRFGPPLHSSLLSGLFGMINLARCARTSTRRAPGAQVHVMLTEDGHAFMPSNPAAPADALISALINGEFRGHLLDAKGVTMKMGRARRLISHGQETALLARWLFQCAMPGCNHTRFLEFHHLQEFSRGGPTDPHNLVPLCSACHSLVTHGLATIAFDPMNPTDLRFSFRDGSVYVSKNRGLPVREATTESTLDRHKQPCPAGSTLNWDEEPMISFDDDPEENSAAAEKL